MDAVFQQISALYTDFGPAILVPVFLFAATAIFAQWSLYEKCNQPGYACIVPVWNIIAFLKIMGRPAWHIVLFLVPIYNIYFIVKVYMELCNCFGKRSLTDYLLVIFFNGFYVMYLGLAHDAKYYGPVYGKDASN